MADEPPSISRAVARMGQALHALRLEVPRDVANDVTARWRDLLDAIEFDVGRTGEMESDAD